MAQAYPPLTAARERIVETLLRDGPLSLQALADRVGLAHTTVLHHLRSLRGWVTVDRVRDVGVRKMCKARSGLLVTWLDAERGLLDTWMSTSAPDWRFPLVSRVPDAPTQGFLLEWLDRATARQILPVFRSRFEPADPVPPSVVVAVYGSCARGDAGHKADMDILVLTDPAWPGAEALADLAHEVALDHARPVDIQALTQAGMQALPEGFCANLRREAVTVWFNDPDADLVEDPLGVRDAD